MNINEIIACTIYDSTNEYNHDNFDNNYIEFDKFDDNFEDLIDLFK